MVRTYGHISAMVEEARLPDRVRDRALATFRVLAEAEGRLHRRPTGQVHFHEVGGVDAIVDVIGTCTALELLDVDDVTASPIAQGIGMVRSAHGAIPNPAAGGRRTAERRRRADLRPRHPARAHHAHGRGAPRRAGIRLRGRCRRCGSTATGFGAGDRELAARPNLTQVVIGTRVEERPAGQPVVLLEANVDDVTGETLGHTIGVLLEAGAHDAWVTPIVMKKGRPAHTVSALVDPAAAAAVIEAIVRETGTLGVRGSTLERWPQPRTTRRGRGRRLSGAHQDRRRPDQGRAR